MSTRRQPGNFKCPWLGTVHDLRACFWEAAYPPRQSLSQASPVPHLREGAIPISQSSNDCAMPTPASYFGQCDCLLSFLSFSIYHNFPSGSTIFVYISFLFLFIFTFSNTHFSHYLCTLDDFYRVFSDLGSEANNLW